MRLLHCRVTGLEPEAHQVRLDDGTHLPYDRLLLAMGAEALPLQTPGGELAGVVRLDSLEEVRAILKLCHGRQTAVVVGGGITALELVEGLRARGVKVHYFMRQARYWSNVLDEAESQMVEERLTKEGVVLHPRTELAEIIGQGGRVSAVRTTDGLELKCSLVGYAIGVWPKVALARAAGLAIKRGILVDEHMQTSVPGIYAAGDVAEVLDPVSGQTVLDTLWSIARAEGRTAGLNMADCPTPYVRTAPLNVTRLAGLTTTIIGAVGRGGGDELTGIARGDSETWRQLPDGVGTETGSPVNHLRLAVGRSSSVGRGRHGRSGAEPAAAASHRRASRYFEHPRGPAERQPPARLYHPHFLERWEDAGCDLAHASSGWQRWPSSPSAASTCWSRCGPARRRLPANCWATASGFSVSCSC